MSEPQRTQTDQPLVSGPWIAVRAFWVLAIPCVCALAPFIVEAVLTQLPTAVPYRGVLAFCAAVLVPFGGVVGPFGYGVASRDRVLLWPFVPYALTAIAFGVAMVDLVNNADESTFPLVQLGLALLMPVLAFFGGFVSFVAIGPGGHRRRPERLETTHPDTYLPPDGARYPLGGPGARQIRR